MSLRSGRVGVNPEDVNPINGKINVEVPDNVYTKTQADNKFETKTHAGNTYLTKTEAEALQPINLAVPVPLLNGSALTVENALQGLSDACVDVAESACTDIISGASVAENRNYLFKNGKIVQLLLQLTDVTVTTAWTDIVCKIPEGYRPKVEFRGLDVLSNSRFRVQPNGELNIGSTISASGVLISVTWITA